MGIIKRFIGRADAMSKKNRTIQILGERFFNTRSEEDFEVLYKVLRPNLLIFLEKNYGNSKYLDYMDIQDCVTDALVIVYNNIHQYKRFYRFSTWSYTIAKNELLKLIIKKKSKGEIYVINIDESIDTLHKICLNYTSLLPTSESEERSIKNSFMYNLIQEISNQDNGINKKYPNYNDYIQENAIKDEIFGISEEEKIQRMSDIVVQEITNLDDRYRSVVWERDINRLSYNEISYKYKLQLNTCKVFIHKGRKIVKNKLQKIYDEWKYS